MTQKMNYKIDEITWGETLTLPSSRSLRGTSHIIGGRYPCRSVAYIPRLLLSPYQGRSEMKVLDPFMGSGTTAIEALSFGFTPYGLEVDPFARMVSEASTYRYTDSELQNIVDSFERILLLFKTVEPQAKFIPKTRNIEYWFDEDNFMDLLKLKTAVYQVAVNSVIRRFFLTVIADIIRASSKAERQSLKPYISKKFTKPKNDVLETFAKSYRNYYSAVESSSKELLGKSSGIQWVEGDATNFSCNNEIDIAITSPPYINSMDYVRCIKLESAWIDTGNDDIFSNVRQSQLGEQVRAKKKNIDPEVEELVGSELEYLKTLDSSRHATAMAYFQDMVDNLKCVKQALKYDGRYHIIIGNSVMRSKEVQTHKLIAQLGELVGFDWTGYFNYPIRDHRTSLPRNGNGGKISVEHVITLKKG